MTKPQPSTELPPAPRYGHGISHPRPGEKTRLHHLMVAIPGSKPMRFSIKAETAKAAKGYALNRWPSASVVVVR